MAPPLPHPAPGFTLVELSVVLVVIGLLAGGILVGRDMILVAEARSLVGQAERYSTAVQTFRLKFNCLPGDCKTATLFGLGNDGDGDGMLGSVIDPGPHYNCLYEAGPGTCLTAAQGGTGEPNYGRSGAEPNQFWVHLQTAGLTPDRVATMPNAGNYYADYSAVMDQYFPRAANGLGHLTVLTWNGKTYLHSGISATAPDTSPRAHVATVTGSQMRYVMDKAGASFMVESNYLSCGMYYYCGYPLAFQKGQKVIPSGVYLSTNGAMYVNPLKNGYGWPDCGRDSGGVFSLKPDGACNFFWELTMGR